MKKQFEQYLNDIKRNYHVADSQLLKDEVLSDDSRVYYYATSIENKDSILKNGFLFSKVEKIPAIYFSKGLVGFKVGKNDQKIVFLADLSNIDHRLVEGDLNEGIAIEEDISPEVIFGWIVIGKVIEDNNGTRRVVYDKNQG